MSVLLGQSRRPPVCLEVLAPGLGADIDAGAVPGAACTPPASSSAAALPGNGGSPGGGPGAAARGATHACWDGPDGRAHLVNRSRVSKLCCSASSPFLPQADDDPKGDTDVIAPHRIGAAMFKASFQVAAGASSSASYACVDTWLTAFRNDLPKIDIPTLVVRRCRGSVRAVVEPTFFGGRRGWPVCQAAPGSIATSELRAARPSKRAAQWRRPASVLPHRATPHKIYIEKSI